MSEEALEAERRSETGKRPAGRMRRAGRLPAVVYGLDAGAVPLSVVAHDVEHLLHSAAGANTLIVLRVDGADQLTLARQIQRHPVKGHLVHVDFVRIRADRPVEAEVPLHLVGTPEGVDLGGMLEQQLFTLSIEAKPGDIPNAIEHDISALGIGDQVRVGDVALPAGVTPLQEPDELVAAVAAPRGLEEAVEGEAVEGEAVEGEAPSAEGEDESGGEG